MTTTAQQLSTPTASVRADERRTFPWALIVALIALAALTIAVVTWQLTSSTNTSAPVSQAPKAAADPLAAYRSGGSIYQQQVPKAALTNWPLTGPAARSTSSRSPQPRTDRASRRVA